MNKKELEDNKLRRFYKKPLHHRLNELSQSFWNFLIKWYAPPIGFGIGCVIAVIIHFWLI